MSNDQKWKYIFYVYSNESTAVLICSSSRVSRQHGVHGVCSHLPEDLLQSAGCGACVLHAELYLWLYMCGGDAAT